MVLDFPSNKQRMPYAVGYADGLRDGEKYATEKLFWVGVAAGLILAAAIALTTIYVVAL